MSTLFETNNNNNVPLEVEQNALNKQTASKRRFFASKVHKLKKMLKPVLKLMSASRGGGGGVCSCQKSPAVSCTLSNVEDIQNAMNEALETRLCGNAKPYRRGDAALPNIASGNLKLVAIRCDGTVFYPVTSQISSADYDIRVQGDLYPVSFYQEAEQQTPHYHSHLY